MITTLDDVTEAQLEFDVVIVGAGAAGITLALELEGSGLSVALLEGGGVEPSPRSQDRYKGPLSVGEGLSYPPLDAWRLRFLGGTTGHWTGFCRPLDANVFQVRPGVVEVGWPFGRDELERFYRRAHTWLGLGRYEYDVDVLCADAGVVPRIRSTDRVAVHSWRLSTAATGSADWLGPVRFGASYSGRLERSSTQVITGANCVGLDVSRGRVDAIEVASDDGRRVRVIGDVVVLACGGIENVRQLLLAAEVEPGLLRSGMLGTGFGDHPHVPVASMLGPAEWVTDPTIQAVPPLFDVDGTAFKLGLTPAADVASALGLPNVSFTIETAVDPSWPATDVVDITDLWSLAERRPTALYGLYARAEPRANASSRVYLADERDDLGLPRAGVDWRVAEVDFEAIARARRVVLDALLAQGFGPSFVEIDDQLGAVMTGGAHHMGGARMHESAALGVVDPNLRCHALSNLYVAGSATFPSYGFSNPTLTVVALAVRLADHLAAAS